jgi:hypothetical protein
MPTFADIGYHVVSVTNPYGRIIGFLDRSSHFFFQVAPVLYSRGWVDPVPDPLLLRKPGSAGNRTQTSGLIKISYTNKIIVIIYFVFDVCVTQHMKSPPITVAGSAALRHAVCQPMYSGPLFIRLYYLTKPFQSHVLFSVGYCAEGTNLDLL